MRRSLKKFILSALFFVLIQSALFAEIETISRKKSVNWHKGVLIIDVRMDINNQMKLLPKSRYLAEKEIERVLPALFIEAILDIPIDSFQTIGERIKGNEAFFRELNDLALSGSRKQFAYLSQDMKQVHVRYEFPFFGDRGLITPFIEHSRPYPIKRVLGFVPSRSFTGLVIYAGSGKDNSNVGEAGKGYPAYGKNVKERIKPCFFPKLYDEDMNLILNPEMCEPEYLMKWGMVAYTDSVDEKAHLERIGVFPLRTMARGVFGKNSTDILIPNDIARKLLSREGNHELLKKGRILIIID